MSSQVMCICAELGGYTLSTTPIYLQLPPFVSNCMYIAIPCVADDKGFATFTITGINKIYTKGI